MITSCTACPHRAKTWSWNFPCIWPTVSARSNPSILANNSNFGTCRSRNFELKFSNHPDQYFSDFDKSILHLYNFLSGLDRLCGFSCAAGGGSSGAGVVEALGLSSSSGSSAMDEWLNTEVEHALSAELSSFCASGKGSSFVANSPVSILNKRAIQIIHHSQLLV